MLCYLCLSPWCLVPCDALSVNLDFETLGQRKLKTKYIKKTPNEMYNLNHFIKNSNGDITFAVLEVPN